MPPEDTVVRLCLKTDGEGRSVGCVLARTRENRDLRVGASTHPTCFETKPSIIDGGPPKNACLHHEPAPRFLWARTAERRLKP